MPQVRENKLYTSQPGKAIWTTLSILFNLARLPFWIVYFIPKGLRQHPNYSYKKAISIRFTKAFLTWWSDVEAKTPFNLTAGAEKDQWTTIEAAASRYYAGVALADPTIKPAKIGGTWYPAKPSSSKPSKKVVLHLHGGAFVLGDGRKKDTAFLCNTLVKHAGVSHVFACQYRLSSNPDGRFPAALQDAITAYAYLINEQNIKPADIIISGDSAGGNLTLSLVRYLADHGQAVNLPQPACAWLWSPWVHPGGTIDGTTSFDDAPQAQTDYLNDGFGKWGAREYAPAPSTGLTLDSEYINFLDNPFSTEVPLYFSVCENEVLHDSGKRTYDSFSKIKGNKTEISFEKDSPHDVILVAPLTGFEAEAVEAAKKAGKYLSRL